MTEIVVTKNRKGQIRYGWKCLGCKAAAGAWPQQKTAVSSMLFHEARDIPEHKSQEGAPS